MELGTNPNPNPNPRPNPNPSPNPNPNPDPNLVKVLEESKTRYSTWLAQVTSDTLELMFGS